MEQAGENHADLEEKRKAADDNKAGDKRDRRDKNYPAQLLGEDKS